MFVFDEQVKNSIISFRKHFNNSKVFVIEHLMIDLFNGKNKISKKIFFFILTKYFFRYKIIDSVRPKLYPRGSLNKESAAYICRELNLNNDVAYGNTKLFIKQP